MLNSISFSLPAELEDRVLAEINASDAAGRIRGIWNNDADVWTSDDEAKWLGWLGIIDEELKNLDRYRSFADDVNANFETVLLMGMGGSSLAPEVLAKTFERPRFRILDSTVPAQVTAVEEGLDLRNTLFIVASKSGSTLEPNCFKQYFFDRLSSIVGKSNAGKQFVAITDPGSKMEQIAKDDGFRHIFYGKPEIGGRFSALSAFGLTAGASMGVDPEMLLSRAKEMAEACRTPSTKENPGALLGTILGVCQTIGRDKLTIFTSREIHDLGAWLEQLIAESTGKNGIAIIPVDREPIQRADSYSDDRIFVHVSVKGSATDEDEYTALEDIERAGHPVVRIELESLYHLSQEFFRWEFATAVAGSIMKINPFNQPDVESAKIEARKLTDEYEATGEFPDETPFFETEGIKLFTGPDYTSRLKRISETESLSGYLKAHLSSLSPGDYFALLAYIQMNEASEQTLQSIRETVLENHRVATCLGFGPRFLHSTGQAYKGGGNNGVFLQITSDDEIDMPVPGQKYTFGIVKTAQARGDFQVLIDRGRRALRVHLTSDVAAGLQQIKDPLGAGHS